MPDTIFALSSGKPPAGVAVIRVSGDATRFILETIAGLVPPARRATLVSLRQPVTGEAIDRALALFFPAPASFTGEDVAEFHVHGGRAVVAALLAALASIEGCRIAEPGEFTRRAFEAGRIDLTAAEGLADLIASETESQRRQALRQAGGALARQAADWRAAIVRAQALVEAGLDFTDEEDVPELLVDQAIVAARPVCEAIAATLADGGRGERVRDGFEVVLMGATNAGKSTLLNVVARRDVAIVTDIPGTTRDVMEVHLDLGGFAVTLVDTAGLREAGDVIEAEGIRRGRARGAAADLVLWLDEFGRSPPAGTAETERMVMVMTKADLGRPVPAGWVGVSAQEEASVARLVGLVATRAADSLGGEPALITQARQRRCLEEAAAALMVFAAGGLPEEIAAEQLRAAAAAIGRLAGRIDVEDVLGEIFGRFCIGK